MTFPTPHIGHARHGLFFTRCQSNAKPSEKYHDLPGIRTRDLWIGSQHDTDAQFKSIEYNRGRVRWFDSGLTRFVLLIYALIFLKIGKNSLLLIKEFWWFNLFYFILSSFLLWYNFRHPMQTREILVWKNYRYPTCAHFHIFKWIDFIMNYFLYELEFLLISDKLFFILIKII
jgi:hypothetical protein